MSGLDPPEAPPEAADNANGSLAACVCDDEKCGSESELEVKQFGNDSSEIPPHIASDVQYTFDGSPSGTGACTYPTLPKSAEVEVLLAETEAELRRLRRLQMFLARSRKSDLLEVSPVHEGENGAPSSVHDHFGLMVPHQSVAHVMEQNRNRIGKVRNRTYIGNRHNFERLSHLPFLQENLQNGMDMLDPIVRVVFENRELADEKAHRLTHEYVDRHAIYDRESEALKALHTQDRQLIDDWPREMATQGLKTKDRDILYRYVALDQQMYLDDVEFGSYALHDMNGYVEDPLRAHNQFRNRIAWSPEETRIFLDKYRLHPREFRKIAGGLPYKSVKDVVEFYYRNRVQLQLKKIEQQSRKRRKKVIVEGSVRK